MNNNRNFDVTFLVDKTPDEAFKAINNVRGWWSEDIAGPTDQLGAEFRFRAADLHLSTQKITEFVPGQKVVWRVLDSQINFVEDKHEWTGTDIIFEIARKNDRTELSFTHVGLTRALACYGSCADAWGFYINHSLFNLISSGQGEPDHAPVTGPALLNDLPQP